MNLFISRPEETKKQEEQMLFDASLCVRVRARACPWVGVFRRTRSRL